MCATPAAPAPVGRGAYQRVPLAAFAARVMMLHQLDLRPVLPAIRQPMLLVCGDSDPLIGIPILWGQRATY